MDNDEISRNNLKIFSKKVWIATSITAFIVIMLLLFKALFFVGLLVLTAALIALFFNGLSALICRYTEWPSWFCTTLSIIVAILVVGLLSWFIGDTIQKQFITLTSSLPDTIANAKEKLSQSSVGRSFVEFLSSPEAQARIKSITEKTLTGLFNAMANIYVIFFIALFFIASPGIYINGIILLIPEKGKSKTKDILYQTGTELKKWLKGKLFAMFVVFILTAGALVIIGMPMVLVLALIAGILNFIPNFGPLIAMIPAVLVALTIGESTAWIVAILYTVIQILESNFITPLVQQKLVKVPPALIITGQVIMGTLSGILGLLLATPIIIILMVVIKLQYLKRRY